MESTKLANVSPVAGQLELNTGAMLASGASMGAIRLAGDLIRHVWWPQQRPFPFDPDELSTRLQLAAPGCDWTAWRIRRYQSWALVFFREVMDNHWAPIAEFYRAGSVHEPVRAQPLAAASNRPLPQSLPLQRVRG